MRLTKYQIEVLSTLRAIHQVLMDQAMKNNQMKPPMIDVSDLMAGYVQNAIARVEEVKKQHQAAKKDSVYKTIIISNKDAQAFRKKMGLKKISKK